MHEVAKAKREFGGRWQGQRHAHGGKATTRIQDTANRILNYQH